MNFCLGSFLGFSLGLLGGCAQNYSLAPPANSEQVTVLAVSNGLLGEVACSLGDESRSGGI